MNKKCFSICFLMITLTGTDAGAQSKTEQDFTKPSAIVQRTALSVGRTSNSQSQPRIQVCVDNRRLTVSQTNSAVSKPNVKASTTVAKTQQGTNPGVKLHSGEISSDKDKKRQTNPTGVSIEQPESSKTRKSGARLPVFIPPPPPTVPIGSIPGLIGAPIGLLSAEELKKRAVELAGQITELSKELASLESRADEKRKRSTLFASLYTEGVVSRRELEASQHEDSEASAELKTGRNKLATLQKEQTELESQLRKLVKRTDSKASRAAKKSERKVPEKKLD
jgi:hypothetical protein